MADQTGKNNNDHSGEDPNDEALRKLFQETFGDEDPTNDPKNDPSKQESDPQKPGSKGPSMGFTGNPGAGSQKSGDSSANDGAAGSFPGFPPGFDPSQMLSGMGADPQMMQQIMGQVQSMFSAMQNQGDGEVVNWDMTKNAAMSAINDSDQAITTAESHQIDNALRLADMWLDEATTFESTGQIGQAFSRRQWVERTFESWQRLTEPVAESVGRAMGQVVRQQLEDENHPGIPEEIAAMLPAGAASQMSSMMERMGGIAFGTQIGQAIGELAAEVHSGSDIGLPMAGNSLALVPANIKNFAEGLQVEDEEILLYVALRETARMRLFMRAPWLDDDLFNAVAQYAAGIHINMERVEEAASQIDPSNPEELENLFGDGLFQTDRTPMQQAALVRIETILALIEGWVDDVVSQAGSHLPSINKLRETMNRRRASGGPAEATFAALVGLELRPRRLRDAAQLWSQLRDEAGVEGRDNVWAHPDLQPDEQDLDDPAGYFNRRSERESENAKIEEELQKLLAEGYGSGEGTPTAEGGHSASDSHGSEDKDEDNNPDDGPAGTSGGSRT